MSDPAFRLRLPCIPFVPKIEGSLISSCSVRPVPGPCFIPPVPPPPPPSFGCYEMGMSAGTTATGGQFSISASVSYPYRAETGFCQPVITINLHIPKKGGGTSSSSNSSGSGSGPGPGPGKVRFVLLADVACNESTCEITKYFKNLDYDTETYLVYWV